jgi:biopolymer transport protein ExbB
MAGGVVMYPILLCSVLAMAITIERLWTLQRRRITPDNLVAQIWQWTKAGGLDSRRLQDLKSGSPLGRILAAGLVNRHHPREVMLDAIEDVGRHVGHELGRYLNILGTIAAMSPLLGLLGTVLGMIRMFNAIQIGGMDPTAMAGGISEALICTAAGLAVALPSLFFYRFLIGRVDHLVILMEMEALKLVEVLHGERERDFAPPAPTAPAKAAAAADRGR